MSQMKWYDFFLLIILYKRFFKLWQQSIKQASFYANLHSKVASNLTSKTICSVRLEIWPVLIYFRNGKSNSTFSLLCTESMIY